MSSYDYCKRCEFPRFVEGFTARLDYLNAGWVETIVTTARVSKSGVKRESVVSTWLCPVCAEQEEAERQRLMDIGSAIHHREARERGED